MLIINYIKTVRNSRRAKMKFFLIVLVIFSTALAANMTPITPDSIITQLFGDTTKAIDFYVQTTDPDNDKIAYQFDWGDGIIADWSAYSPSGYLFTSNHLYKNTGSFLCSVRVKDEKDSISDWSQPCTLNILPQLLKWVYESESGIFSGCAVGKTKEIYFTCEDGTLHCLDPDGTPLWKFSTTPSIYSAPTVGEKAVYITSDDSKLYAINFAGNEIWNFKAERSITSTPALGKNENIYFGCDDGNLYAVSNTGKLLWKFKTGDEIAGSPSIGKDGTIYIGSDSIYAISPNGKKKWIYRPAEEDEVYFFASPAIGSDGTIYIGGTDGALYAITNNGRLKWRALNPDEDAIRACGAIDKSGIIYFGAENGILYKKEMYGEVTQLYESDDYIFSTPAIDTLGNIYFVSDDGFLYCIKNDGKLLFKWTIAEDSKEMMYSPSPIISDDGMVYVGSWEGKFYAFQGFAPPAKSSWPMFRHDQQNSARIEK